MPELPEVETIARQLNKRIKGKKIEKVEVHLVKLVKYSLEKFKKIVVGAEIKSVSRRAKLLIIELSSGYSLIIHLKLTGQLILNGEINKHTHLIYYFSDKSYLIHNDLRQFGFVKVIEKEKLEEYFEKEKFGPEPLDRKFTLSLFRKILDKRKNSKIKPLLMDPKFVAGIGNIYSDEILFHAIVLPIRIIKTLKSAEIKKIYQEIKRILKLAIEKKGSSNRDYFDAYGQKGNFVPLIKVYQRQGKLCFKCRTKIKRIKIGARSAHFCPKCQI
ncbi:bifunctional DNA-formamidopyrimidine glycosylase/DNA-(apurinic or apyrimidinic site) lyase [Patescibacteria group bacterium]|nr:bifunctional DNA-formamidopyrimidine glycosylase/DNA-(apurinic or apyrimidinic site) lyase [Patescibacteria group bacterium]MBU1563630.1 bifunctional DNA-formamidopyrimidine glycosylase/DNA-(apurinic or apyrimidinic site) lyase [Patescibacteria group bacterium]MBU2068034.1 bifunctional DNA-formamidopyrimidine glycosylase/DNA-(apurinic or apyrimidinic site) lyase [Patescibacteria group bacterium]